MSMTQKLKLNKKYKCADTHFHLVIKWRSSAWSW